MSGHWSIPKREVRDFFRQLETQYNTAVWLGEVQKCDTNKLQSSSTINTGSSSPNTSSLPEWWLSRKKEPLKEGYVRQRKAGRYLERRVVNVAPSGGHIRKLPHEKSWETYVDEYGVEQPVYFRPYVLTKDIEIDEETGEETIYVDTLRFMRDRDRNGMENPRRIARACDNLKWLVRANERRIRLFVTLTYAENMQDTRRLYEDFRRFWMKLRYHYPAVSGYLVAFEPQKRGAWHAHVLLVSDVWNLRIPNKEIHRLWRYGYTKTKRPKSIHDVGSYLTSYLTNIKEGKRTKKGARLYLYKAGFHFMRHSKKGISYCDTTRWHGDYTRIPDLEHRTLLYEHINTRKLSNNDMMVTQVICFEMDKDYYNAYF